MEVRFLSSALNCRSGFKVFSGRAILEGETCQSIGNSLGLRSRIGLCGGFKLPDGIKFPCGFESHRRYGSIDMREGLESQPRLITSRPSEFNSRSRPSNILLSDSLKLDEGSLRDLLTARKSPLERLIRVQILVL